MEVGSGGYLPNCEAASRLIFTSSRRRWGEYMYFFSDILKKCDNMTQKDGFNSSFPLIITIFSDKNPALLARRWLEKDIRRFKSQSAHAFNAVYRYSIIVDHKFYISMLLTKPMMLYLKFLNGLNICAGHWREQRQICFRFFSFFFSNFWLAVSVIKGS